MSDPFLTESSEALTARLLKEVCAEGDGKMWSSRAKDALHALLVVLVHLRDRGEQTLTLTRIRESFHLPAMVALARRSDLPPAVVEPLRDYLRALPGFTESAAKGEPLGEVAQEQHGYLQMQFTRAWST